MAAISSRSPVQCDGAPLLSVDEQINATPIPPALPLFRGWRRRHRVLRPAKEEQEQGRGGSSLTIWQILERPPRGGLSLFVACVSPEYAIVPRTRRACMKDDTKTCRAERRGASRYRRRGCRGFRDGRPASTAVLSRATPASRWTTPIASRRWPMARASPRAAGRRPQDRFHQPRIWDEYGVHAPSGAMSTTAPCTISPRHVRLPRLRTEDRAGNHAGPFPRALARRGRRGTF